MNLKRLAPGLYTATDTATGRTCTIERRPDLDGHVGTGTAWLTTADWDGTLYGDPDPTYREAKITAGFFFNS